MKPYFSEDGIVIYHGDCREILPSLGGVPCVIADPPYGDTALDWDSRVSGWLDAVWQVLQPGTLWCYGSFRFFLECSAEFQERFALAQDVIWEKQNGSGFHADRFRRVHEYIVQFYPANVRWQDCIKNPPRGHRSDHKQVIRHAPPKHTGHIGAHKYETRRGEFCLQRSVIKERNCHREAVHPTQKPVGLSELLLKYSTNSGDTIISPFMGSGTDLVAAKNTGRKAIGMDTEEKHCEIAAKRLSQKVLNFDIGASHPQSGNELSGEGPKALVDGQ